MNELVPASADTLAVRTFIDKAVVEQDVASLEELRGRADAMGLYHRRAGARVAANDAGEIKVRAERGLGQIDLQAHKHGGNRKGDQVQGGLNLIAGVNHDTRAAWRLLGKLSDDRFDRFVDIAREDEESGINTSRLVELVRTGSTGSSTTFECYTPARYIEAARVVLGTIDLDPASSAEANETVQASEYFDADIDGLSQDWRGRVWLNPPYGRSLTATFVTKAVDEFAAGNTTAAIILLNAYGFDAKWFQPLFAHTLCFTDHRVPFYGGGPTFGSLFVYLGPERALFAATFEQFGAVVARWLP